MSPKPWTEGREVEFKVSRLLGFMGFRIIGFRFLLALNTHGFTPPFGVEVQSIGNLRQC